MSCVFFFFFLYFFIIIILLFFFFFQNIFPSPFNNIFIDVGWPIAPFGFKLLLGHIQKKYEPKGGIIVFENGAAGPEKTEEDAKFDKMRLNYMYDYIKAAHEVCFVLFVFIFSFFLFYL